MSHCPDELLKLIDHFTRQADQVRSPDYNETQLRIDFVNPMFAQLGWDIDNHHGYAEQYREVVHEDRVKVAGQTKAPDYSFRVGGQRKFFLEAKKPAVDIKSDWEPAYQLRRYAWSAKLACSLLTDFEEFAIYDARIQPRQFDKASIARREFIHYTEYPDRWDFLYGTFSKDAVLRGEFDRYCESQKGRGAQLFDDAFLSEIEEWRKDLASNLALRNESLDEAGLNFAVQRIIDRILFLRIAEDRGTEAVGQLQALLDGDDVYDRLGKLFRDADARYNSGLFHFHKERDRDEPPDTLTPRLHVGDRTLKDIIRALYYPQSPYEFTMVSADILGSVYERFLGKVITLTPGHRAKVEDKPEVRKAGGVYYTPTYIVEYIVKHTVGALLEGKSPKDAVKLKVLDPACGSGSFLIGAYQFLLDWYLSQYSADHDAATLATGKRPVLRPAPAGGWALTIAERKRILLDHIHGVDVDGQAVEVTKLNLLLKCLEGETSHTLGFDQRLFKDRALPDLGHNILCGNSLIGTDIMSTDVWKQTSEIERARLNPFDYKLAFPKLFKGSGGGFDVVIGNPPYVRIQRLEHTDVDYIFEHYTTPASKTDLSTVFLEKSLMLLRPLGLAAFIVTSQWFTTDYGRKLRAMLSTGHLRSIVNFGSLPVFDASTYPAIVSLSPTRTKTVKYRRLRNTSELNTRGILAATAFQISHSRLGTSAWVFDGFRLAERIADPKWFCDLSVIADVAYGIITGYDDAFLVNDAQVREEGLESSVMRPFIYRGEEVARYAEVSPSTYLIYPYELGTDGETALIEESEFKSHAPQCFAHLSRHRDRLRSRKDSRQTFSRHGWYALVRQGNIETFEAPKLVVKGIDKRLIVATGRTGAAFSGANCPCIVVRDRSPDVQAFLLGLLNSRLLTYHARTVCPAKLNDYRRFNTTSIARFPICVPTVVRHTSPTQYREFVALVEGISSLHQRLASEHLPQRREQIEREIEVTDRQIDRLVYQFYGLTDHEITIVEDALALL